MTYERLLAIMANTPAIPNRTGRAIAETFTDDLVQIGEDVGRVIPDTPQAAAASLAGRFQPGCGEVGHMPHEVGTGDDTIPQHYAIVQQRYGSCYCAVAQAASPIKPHLIIIPDGTTDTGSRILTIAPTRAKAWKQAAELCSK